MGGSGSMVVHRLASCVLVRILARTRNFAEPRQTPACCCSRPARPCAGRGGDTAHPQCHRCCCRRRLGATTRAKGCRTSILISAKEGFPRLLSLIWIPRRYQSTLAPFGERTRRRSHQSASPAAPVGPIRQCGPRVGGEMEPKIACHVPQRISRAFSPRVPFMPFAPCTARFWPFDAICAAAWFVPMARTNMRRLFHYHGPAPSPGIPRGDYILCPRTSFSLIKRRTARSQGLATPSSTLSPLLPPWPKLMRSTTPRSRSSTPAG
jgi:hypothetical protein